MSRLVYKHFTSSGSWVCPAGVTKVYAILHAGGAGGPGGNTTKYLPGAAAPILCITDVVPNTTYNFTIGAGGNGGLSGAKGSVGGTTYFKEGAYQAGPPADSSMSLVGFTLNQKYTTSSDIGIARGREVVSVSYAYELAVITSGLVNSNVSSSAGYAGFSGIGGFSGSGGSGGSYNGSGVGGNGTNATGYGSSGGGGGNGSTSGGTGGNGSGGQLWIIWVE